jgi:copper(I)-binding protein
LKASLIEARRVTITLLAATVKIRCEKRYLTLEASGQDGRKMNKDGYALLCSLARQIARSIMKLAPLAALLAAATAQASDIAVTDAWTSPNAEIGSDAVLGMAVTNDGAEPDALVRVSCPVANFSEKRQIDIGEGGKSAREVHDIPIAPKSKAILNRDGFHVALLQTRQKLVEGDEFQCSVSFRRAGTIEVQVRVSQKGAK